jgi:hypothetical protein
LISSDYGERRKSERLARERLFRKSRPFIRPFDINRDMLYLWAAYDLGSFPHMEKGLNPSQFSGLVREAISRRSAALVIDDDCRYFKTGRGPVCLVLIDNYGWRIEPFSDFFFWATPRIKLRANVAFFQKIRHDSAVGVCLVKSSRMFANLFNRLAKYGVLRSCGRIPQGYPDGDEFLFQVRGKRNAGTHGAGRQGEVQRDDRVAGQANPGAERNGANPGAGTERPNGPAVVHGEQGRQEAPRPVEPADSDHQQRESHTAAMTARDEKLRDWS